MHVTRVPVRGAPERYSLEVRLDTSVPTKPIATVRWPASSDTDPLRRVIEELVAEQERLQAEQRRA